MKSADIHLQLGHVLKLQGRKADAERSYRAAYLRDPESPHARAELEALGASLPAPEPGRAHGGAAVPGRGATGPSPSSHGDSAQPQRGASAPDATFVRAAYGADAGLDRVPHASLQELLDAHGLTDAFLGLFDHRFYYYANPGVRDQVPQPGRERCLVHFCEAGIDGLLQMAEHLAFDPVFYTGTYLRHLSFTPGNAYRHWLTAGIPADHAPNRDAWVTRLVGTALGGLDALDMPLLAAEGGATDSTWVAQFEAFANGAAAHSPAAAAVTPDTADTLAALADRLAVRGEERKSFAIYERVLLRVPQHGRSLAHYADSLLRQGSFLAAKGAYERLLDGPTPVGAWTYVNLARCCEELGDPHWSLRVLGQGLERFAGDLGLRRIVADRARAHVSKEWDAAMAEGRLGRFADAQGRLHQACGTVTALLQPSGQLAHRTVQRVALFANQDLAQCRLYRVEQKREQLEAAGFQVKVYDFHDDVQEFLAALPDYEAVIFYRVPASYDVITAILKARELGAVTFYDIDDLIFDAGEYPSSLESYGGQVSRDEYIGLKLGVPLFEHAMTLCDYGIASTPALAEHMRKRVRSGTAFVHRNALGQRHAAAAAAGHPARRAGPVTFFYGSGTKAHKEDFQDLVEPALVELVRRHGSQVRIILAGYISMTARLRSISASLTVVEPNWDLSGYWAMLSQVDVNLAVLKPSPMADCKSEIKWLEAAMFGIPSVVSGTATYRGTVTPGVTALVCDTAAEWTAALDRLAADPALRARIGQAAQQDALLRYGADAMAATARRMMVQAGPSAPVARKPSVLIVNVFYPPQAIGGATRVVHDNVRDLMRSHGSRFGFEVFTSMDGGVTPYQCLSYEMDGVQVTGVTTPDDPDIDRRTDDPRMGEVFGRTLDRMRPALVHFHCIQRLTTSVVAAAKSRGIPYVITAHDGWWVSDEQFLVDRNGEMRLYDYARPMATLDGAGQGAFNRLMAVSPWLTGAEKVLAVSEPFAAVYRSCGVPDVMTVANGIPALPTAARSVSPDGRVRLGFIGGLAPHKGYDLIRYALHGNRFTRLRLLAIDHALAAGTSRREVWGATEVEFRGKVPQSEVGTLYGEIDVLLAPSVWPESYGLVTREALSCGCWVIASDRGGIGEYVTPGRNGFIVDASTPVGLEAALGVIDSDPAAYTVPPRHVPEMRQASQQADELATLYAALIERRRTAGGGTVADGYNTSNEDAR